MFNLYCKDSEYDIGSAQLLEPFDALGGDTYMTELDFMKFLDVNLKSIDDKFTKMLEEIRGLKIDFNAKILEIKDIQKECRFHCENQCREFQQKITILEKQAVETQVTKSFMEELDKKQQDRDEHRGKKTTFFWIKLGTFIAFMSLFGDFVRWIYEKYQTMLIHKTSQLIQIIWS